MQGVVAVEGVETFARVATGWFLAYTMCDPLCAGVALADDPVLEGKGVLSLWGAYWRGKVRVVDLGLGWEASVMEWEEAIGRVGGGDDLVFMDGSRAESGWVGGGWWGSRGGGMVLWRWIL